MCGGVDGPGGRRITDHWKEEKHENTNQDTDNCPRCGADWSWCDCPDHRSYNRKDDIWGDDRPC